MHILSTLSLDHFQQMELLERQFYPEEYITSAAEAYAWYLAYPPSVAAMVDQDQVIGFINLFPIKEKIFQGLMAGTFNDKYLTAENIQKDISQPGQFLFLSCVVIAEAYRKTNALQALLAHYVACYEQHLVDWIITDNVTSAGEGFSKKMGLSPHLPSDHGSQIYLAKWTDFIAHVHLLAK